MPSTSLAQILPVEILELIIYHATGARKLRGQQTANYAPTYSSSIMPFLSICSSWRSAALPVFYMDFLLKVDPKLSRIQGPEVFYHGIDESIENSMEHLVSCVSLDVPLSAVSEGVLVDLLSKAPYSGAVFPSAAFLDLRFDSECAVEAKATPESKQNVAKFSEVVKRMFPNLQLVYVHTKYLPQNETYGTLISSILRGIDSSITGFAYIGEDFLQPDALSHLTGLKRLTIRTQRQDGNIVELVRRNSATLEYVYLTTAELKTATKLVQDEEGNTVVYPCLRKLYIQPGDYSIDSNRPSPEGIPFPALTHLGVWGVYPFANDVVFRGNKATLEWLDININNKLQSVLDKYDVFTQNSYPSLRRIAIDYLGSFSTEDLGQKLICVPFDIAPGVQAVKLTVNKSDLGSHLLAAVSGSRARNNIQTLDVRSIKFDASKVIELVKLLPSMNRLHASLAVEDPHGEAATVESDIVSSLHSREHPISTSLRSLNFYLDIWPASRKALAEIQTIASLVPSLRFVVVPDLADDGWQECLRDVTSNPAFGPHADHLRSLTYLYDMHPQAETLPLF